MFAGVKYFQGCCMQEQKSKCQAQKTFGENVPLDSVQIISEGEVDVWLRTKFQIFLIYLVPLWLTDTVKPFLIKQHILAKVILKTKMALIAPVQFDY